MEACDRPGPATIAVDARSGVVYLTENRGAAGFYRFIPKRQGKLAEGGKLQMLAITGRRQFDLRTGQKAGEPLDASWVDINEPDPPDSENSVDAAYRQGLASGAATFARLEGCWYGGDSIYFTSTSGGDKRLGQVWQYTPLDKDNGKIKLIFESPEEAVLDMPDNLCVSPNGGLVVCEDGSNEQYVRGLTRDGRIFDFAKNILPGYEIWHCVDVALRLILSITKCLILFGALANLFSPGFELDCFLFTFHFAQ